MPQLKLQLFNDAIISHNPQTSNLVNKVEFTTLSQLYTYRCVYDSNYKNFTPKLGIL